MKTLQVSLDDVESAARRIDGPIRLTPLLESEALNRQLGFRLIVKAEALQHTGAFKIRGAMNNVLQLTEEEKRRGIFAMSAGNHAQGLAHAAQKFGVPVAILMPHDAPQIKVDRTRAYGAEVIFYNRDHEDRDVVGPRLAKERNLRLIHSYNDTRTIAGQGTVGLEIHQQCRELGVTPDAIIANCSGGGLAAGIALTRDLYATPPQIYTAEPEGFDDAKRSLESGLLQGNDKTSGSICDALLLKLGNLTFPILQHHKAQGLTASDTEVQAAMGLAYDMFNNLILEPGGAVSLAAACLNRDRFKGQVVVVVASGGNIDHAEFDKHIRTGALYRNQMLKPELG